MLDGGLGLAEAIGVVRRELRVAQESRGDGDVRLAVGAVEVELGVEFERATGGEASVKVLGVFSVGGKDEVSRGGTHRVKVTLTPITEPGGDFEVASITTRRPDRMSERSSGEGSGG